MRGADARASARGGRCRADECAEECWAGADERHGDGVDDGGRGLGGRVPGATDRATGMAGGRVDGGVTRGRGAGCVDRKGAGLPELDHRFQPGEEATQAGVYHFDNRIIEPVALHRPGGDRCAEHRELGAQGGGDGFHALFNN